MGTFFHHLFRALSGYVQRWTQQDVPNDCQVLHDFGTGGVPASPVDASSIRNDVLKTIAFPLNVANCSIYNQVVKTVGFPVNYTECSVHNDVTSTLTFPVNTETCSIKNDIVEIITL